MKLRAVQEKLRGTVSPSTDKMAHHVNPVKESRLRGGESSRANFGQSKRGRFHGQPSGLNDGHQATERKAWPRPDNCTSSGPGPAPQATKVRLTSSAHTKVLPTCATGVMTPTPRRLSLALFFALVRPPTRRPRAFCRTAACRRFATAICRCQRKCRRTANTSPE